MDILKFLTIDLIHVLTIAFLGGLLLHFSTGYLFFQNRSFKKIMTVILIGCGLFFILDFIPVIGAGFGLVAFWFLIKYVYNESWVHAGIAWFMSIFIAFLISLIILFLFGLEIIFIPN